MHRGGRIRENESFHEKVPAWKYFHHSEKNLKVRGAKVEHDEENVVLAKCSQWTDRAWAEKTPRHFMGPMWIFSVGEVRVNEEIQRLFMSTVRKQGTLRPIVGEIS